MFIYQYQFIFVMLFACALTTCADGGGETGTGLRGGLNQTVIDDNSTQKKFTTISKGIITSLDGIQVNGVKFNIDTSEIIVDGKTATKDDLALGMVATVYGGIDVDNSQLGQASKIKFDHDLVGVIEVSDLNDLRYGILTVMGQTVFIDVQQSVFVSMIEDVTDFSALTKGNVIRVSGFSDGKGSIVATRIELLALVPGVDDMFTLRGRVSVLDEGQAHFNIGALSVVYAESTLELDGLTLVDGLYVQVDGGLDNGQLMANTVIVVNQGDIGLKAGVDVRVIVQGILTDDDTLLNGQVLDLSNSELDTTSSPITIPIDSGTDKTLDFPVLIIVDGTINAEGGIIGDVVGLPSI